MLSSVSSEASPAAIADSSAEILESIATTYDAKASSDSVSTAVINETISTNVSLSAAALSRMSSILDFSVET